MDQLEQVVNIDLRKVTTYKTSTFTWGHPESLNSGWLGCQEYPQPNRYPGPNSDCAKLCLFSYLWTNRSKKRKLVEVVKYLSWFNHISPWTIRLSPWEFLISKFVGNSARFHWKISGPISSQGFIHPWIPPELKFSIYSPYLWEAPSPLKILVWDWQRLTPPGKCEFPIYSPYHTKAPLPTLRTPDATRVVISSPHLGAWRYPPRHVKDNDKTCSFHFMDSLSLPSWIKHSTLKRTPFVPIIPWKPG